MASHEIDAVFAFVDDHQETYIERLAEVVAIKSVSTWREHRSDCTRAIKWMKNKLEVYGARCQLKDLGHETLPDKARIPLPPVLIGTLGEDPAKQTVLIYGHLDVQPALREDGWNSDPFKLTEKNGNLYGRGATDNKGPVMAWLNVIDAYKGTEIPLPVNLKFVFEGMEECGSKGLDELLRSMKRSDFLTRVDVVCICDNYWLTESKPCITYGLRGLNYFGVEVECADKDLHSGVFGGTIHEAMNDLVWILAQLVDVNNKILIPGIMDDVASVTIAEHKHYEKINFDLAAYQKGIGCQKLVHEGNKEECLTSKWMLPSLSIHGIEGAFHGPGAKTVIPRRVIGKFSIRLVANQDPLKISKLVLSYLDELWKRRKSPNKFRAFVYSEGRSWTSSPTHPSFEAGVRATRKVHGIEPEFTREGGSIPITHTLEEVTGKHVIVLPIGQADDGAHSQNEKISRRNYIDGIKVLAAYLYEVAKVAESNAAQ